MTKYYINYQNQNGASRKNNKKNKMTEEVAKDIAVTNVIPETLTYKPCKNCLINLRTKIFKVKDRLRFSYFDMMNYVKKTFNEGLYTGSQKNRKNTRNYNIEHTVPVSLFSPNGGRNINIKELPPISIEPLSDPHIMFTTNKIANTWRQNYIITDDMDIDYDGVNYNTNIYLIKSSLNKIITLYNANYVNWINTRYKKNFKNLINTSFEENVSRNLLFNDSNTVDNIQFDDQNTTFTTKDGNSITSSNANITKINNWFMEPTCNQHYCSFNCEDYICKFNPRFHSKGDISRSFNYFQLVYGHNPHYRNSNASPDFIFEDKSYRKDLYWLGNYHTDRNCSSFNDKLWDEFYYKQLKMFLNWTMDDLPNDIEHKRNKKIANKTGVANIFIGAFKDNKYIPAEYDLTIGQRHWMADLFLGRPHDCSFYQSLEITPTSLKYITKGDAINNSYSTRCF